MKTEACCAVVSPEGEYVKLFVQSYPPPPDQIDGLIAWAWHNDKPADEYTPCTLPRDADVAREKGYRVIMGYFVPIP